MTALACLSLARCGGGGSLDSDDPFAEVSGSYALEGGFEGRAPNEASFVGSLTLTQASRESGALAGTAEITLTLDGQVVTVAEVPIQNGSVTQDGTVAFRLDGTEAGETWTFTGTQSGNTISGGHTLDAGTATLSGDWTATIGGGAPATGSLTVSAATDGPSPDSDGYTITLDGAARGSLGVNGSISIAELAPGNHAVGLEGIAPHCQLQGENPRTVSVAAGTGATVTFALTCSTPPPTTGTIQITTATSGINSDPDGYRIKLDNGEPGLEIPASGSASFAAVPAGLHTVTLSEIAANCSVSSGTAETVTVQAGATAQINFAVTCTVGTGSRLAPVSGDGQSGTAGTALAQPLVVKVTDAAGAPVPGVTIRWAAAGGGTVSAATSVTDASGLASVTRTLGNVAGEQTTRASGDDLEGSPVTFTHAARAGAPSRVLIVSGNRQTARPGVELANPLVVRVTDAVGNSVPGQIVNWTVVTGGGVASPASSTTDAGGRASTRWRVGSTPGANALDAVVPNVGLVSFTATAAEPTPSASRSRVEVSPGVVSAGQASTITVRVRDAAGILLPGITVTASATGSGNEITPASATTGANGEAEFTFRSSAAGDKTITVVAGGVTLSDRRVITVGQLGSTIAITSHEPNPSDPGEIIRVEFAVTGQDGGAPTGTVTVFSLQQAGGCEGTVEAGFCEMTLTQPGIHNLGATYSGDAQYEESSTSTTVEHEVTGAAGATRSARR
jgi:hypothetical protein